MKNITNRIALFLLLGAITNGVGLAKSARKEVTFMKAVTVNGTLVKSGTYEVAFDDVTNQLSIIKGRDVIATAQASFEKVESDVRESYETRSDPDDATKPPLLVTIALKHGGRATIVNSGD
ncbi:MAG TPA: hypothetical protein VKM94_16400 [Blastocatellia bacterium]|nr:hypothetical protein [Blastocatellia bacterium]